MKLLFLSFLFACIASSAISQMPQAINYQAVARNNNGQPLVSQQIQVRLSIISSATGTPTLYSETRQVTTNALGLFNVQIGTPGTITKTGELSTIDWINNIGGSKKMKVELDISNSGMFTEIGTQNLTSVPYAFAAENAVNTTKLAGFPIATNTPLPGDVLKWTGTEWQPQRPATVYTVTNPANVVSGGSLAFAWAAQPKQITVYRGQVITTVMTMTLGTFSGTATQLGIAPAYQAVNGTITAFDPANYITISALSARMPFTVSGTIKVIAANVTPQFGEIAEGIYNIGLAIRNTSPISVNNSDAINGFVLVQ